MTLSRNDKPWRLSMMPGVLLALLASCWAPAWASPDTVTLRDGRVAEGKVLELDGRRLVLETETGERRAFSRADLASIVFGQEEPPPVVVRVRVFSADDEVRVYVDGEPAASPDELRRGWVDIAPLLHDGANEIYAEVLNRGKVWAYRWVIEAGGERTTFSCGIPHRSGCTAGDLSPTAQGTLPGGKAWLYLHRRDGEVSVEKEQE